MFRAKMKAFVKYDGRGKLVPSSLVLTDVKPSIDTWIEVDIRLSNFAKYIPKTTYNRAFIRYSARGIIIPGSLMISRGVPYIGNWLEIPMSIPCLMCTTTSTTTIR